MLRWVTAGEITAPRSSASWRASRPGWSVTDRRLSAPRWPGAGSGTVAALADEVEQDEVRVLGGSGTVVTQGGPLRVRDRQHRVAQVADRDGATRSGDARLRRDR